MTDAPTVSDRIQSRMGELTRAERQLAGAILQSYPASGLGPLAALAEEAGVSVPTVARMVLKLGFNGYQEFQAALRGELRAVISGPIAKRERWAGGAPSGHVLNRFTEAVIANIQGTLGQIEPERFDAACRLVADPDRHLYVAGGRITRTLAEYLVLHMQVIRPRVTHIAAGSSAWPHHLLDLEEGDVLVLFDMRRYENAALTLARIARDRGARVILFTDQWRSPVHALAEVTFGSRIVAPSAWDSLGATLLLVESMISAAQDLTWGETKARMEALEEMFDRARLFRKFS